MWTLVEFWENVKIALAALWSNRMRSVLTTLGIVIGVSTVIAIVSLVQGLNRAFYKEISSLGTDTLYIQKFPWMVTSAESWAKFRNRKNITMKEYRAVVRYASYARAVSPEVSTRRVVKYRDRELEDVLITGTNEEYPITNNTPPARGRFLNALDVRHRRNVCVLGADVADKLFGEVDPIGRRISIGGYKLRVVGVLEKRGKIFGFNPDIVVVMPIGVFFKLFGTRRSLDITVKVVSADYLDEAKDDLVGILRRVRKVPPRAEEDFAINQQSLLTRTYKNLTSSLWAVAIGVGSISLLVGGIGIMNIMLVSVTERTREIGIRKAVGAKKRHILWQFLIEAMMVCAVGVVIGVLVAIGLAKLISLVTPLPAAMTWWIGVLGIAFVVTIGLIFGIYPSSKAARLNPIDALRYE